MDWQAIWLSVRLAAATTLILLAVGKIGRAHV